MMHPRSLALACCLLFPGVAAWAGIEDLRAEYRDGQVFLQWREVALPDKCTLNVYIHNRPIDAGNLADARRVGFHIEPHSARDWTKDPASFEPDDPAAPPVGFRIQDGGPRLDPQDGLFVHTVTARDAADSFYAVTFSEYPPKAEPVERTDLPPGANTLAQPVRQQVAPIRPVWDAPGQPPRPAAGLPLLLVLHSRRGGRTMNYYDYMLFGDAQQGWREGLPHFFKVVVEADHVRVLPSDRVWLGRGRAFHSFWYGYNSLIYLPRAMQEKGQVVNYGERRLLWLLDWAQREFKTDPDRVYVTGSSMGGCGTISMALHHPQRFAAAHAHVPVVAYTLPVAGYTQGTDWRLTGMAGPLAGKAPTSDGMTLLERMDGVAWAEKARDLPFISLVNGRMDGSIPWYNNPPFYAAMNRARHAFAAYWDNGGHGDAGANAPEDVKAWQNTSRSLLRYSLKSSFPAFSNCSADLNPGNGQKTDGDVVGWINRGMDWKDVEDAPDRYAVSVAARFDGLTYPVTVDMTPRRALRFTPAAGAVLAVSVNGNAVADVTTDAQRLVTVPKVVLPSADWVRIEITSRP